MGDDWKPGDLALCVVGGPAIKAGEVHTVESVYQFHGDLGLLFEGVSPAYNIGWRASCFRKIEPHTPDAEDAETIRLLTGKPVQEPVS